MTFDKINYLREFIKCITNERYEAYELLEDYAKGEYKFKKEEHKEEQKVSKKRKTELKNIIAKKKGKNIDEELEEYRDLIEEAKFPNFETWWENNQESTNNLFWDSFQQDITEELKFGTFNKFEIDDTRKGYWAISFNEDYNFKIEGLDGDWIKTKEGVLIDIKTGKISFEEDVEVNKSLDLLKIWVEWKEDKKTIDKVFDILGYYFDIEFVKECNERFIVIENRRNILKIYKKEWKIISKLDNEEFPDKEYIIKIKSCKDKNSYLVNQL